MNDMNVKSYQIDMIDVGAADAFIIHYTTSDNLWYNVLVDAGNYSNGETIAKNFNKWYPNEYVDLAIVTHPDKDHFGGFIKLLEMMDANDKDAIEIKRFWINDPGNGHIDKDEVKWISKQGSINVKARSVYDLDEGGKKNLMDMLLRHSNIIHEEKFAKPGIKDENGLYIPQRDELFPNFIILGPTKAYYESLIPNFRNDELNFFAKEGDAGYDEKNDIEEDGKSLSKALDDAKEDTSTHNRSSIIFIFEPKEGEKYLFTGDASIESFAKMYKSGYNYTENVEWLKLPHHGSKHNLNSSILRHFKPRVTYVSAKKYEQWLNKCVVNALKKLNTEVYSTHQGGSKLHNGNRDGYSKASKL